MTNIVERLRARADAFDSGQGTPMAPLDREAADEIELLRDTLKRHAGDVKDAMQEIERLTAEFELFREAPSKLEVAQYEIERLRIECEEWRGCAEYDPMMDGPRFKGWNRSGLERCRKDFIEGKRND